MINYIGLLCKYRFIMQNNKTFNNIDERTLSLRPIHNCDCLPEIIGYNTYVISRKMPVQFPGKRALRTDIIFSPIPDYRSVSKCLLLLYLPWMLLSRYPRTPQFFFRKGILHYLFYGRQKQ